MKEFPLKDAKATLSAMVYRAVAGEPTVVTRHGRKVAVLVSFEERERVSKVPGFADLADRVLPERSEDPLAGGLLTTEPFA